VYRDADYLNWKFVDKPRKAYKVMVLPPRDDD